MLFSTWHFFTEASIFDFSWWSSLYWLIANFWEMLEADSFCLEPVHQNFFDVYWFTRISSIFSLYDGWGSWAQTFRGWVFLAVNHVTENESLMGWFETNCTNVILRIIYNLIKQLIMIRAPCWYMQIILKSAFEIICPIKSLYYGLIMLYSSK